MRYPIINPSTEQQQAWQQLTWDEACIRCEQLPTVFKAHDARVIRLRQHVTFADQALAMLGALNDFELRRVLEDIAALTEQSAPRGVQRYWRDPQIRMTSTAPFQGRHHYLIDYAVVSGKIAVREIFLNSDLLGTQPRPAMERVAMYRVRRGNGALYNKPLETEQARRLAGAWAMDAPTSQITTEYAAVNGMKNPLETAAWLMGVHMDAAFRTANPKAYTLFHNPSRSALGDLAECLWDKMPLNRSQPAQHLSAVLRQRQAVGQPTQWVAHSQGAIIFHAAVSLHNQLYRTPLDRHRVAIHGSGAFLPHMRNTLSRAGVGIVHVRNNPFDVVPNVAGSNNLGTSSLYRSLRFMGLVIGDNGGHCAVSPHTLPYLGVCNYRQQLQMAGETQQAERVTRYIERRNLDRQRRRD